MIDTNPGTANPRVTLCSTVSEASGEDPAGSAWALRRIVLVELPLPWPYNVLEARHAPAGITELLKEIWEKDGASTGMIGFASDPDWSVDGQRRIIDLRQGSALAGAYERREFLVPEDAVTEHLRKLAFTPDHPDVATRELDAKKATRDFFVCTHGAIDACCATVGYPIYKLMRSIADQRDSPTRVWRCTHFGGHRFAATVLDAPSGRYWGHLKAESLSGLMHRTGAVRDLRRHYRGWAALSEPLWQVAEAELFTTAGWTVDDATIENIAGLATPEEGGTLTISLAHPEHGAAEVDVEITSTGTVRTMDTSKSEELRDARQYRATITRQHPVRYLQGIGRVTE